MGRITDLDARLKFLSFRRLLRRIGFLLDCFCDYFVFLPRYIGVQLLSVLFGLLLVYGSLVGGQITYVLNNISLYSGWIIKDVKIKGAAPIEADKLRLMLRSLENQPLLTYDISALQQMLSQLAWVDHVKITKLYPQSLKIDISPRAAFAIFDSEDGRWVIDSNGLILGRLEHYAGHVPTRVVAGAGASLAFQNLQNILMSYPEFDALVVGYIYIGQRRWDIILKNGIVVKLPSDNAEIKSAIANILRLEAAEKLLERDILSIDFRVPDMAFVEVSPQVKQQLNNKFTAALKASSVENKVKGGVR